MFNVYLHQIETRRVLIPVMFHPDELSSSYSIALWLEILVSSERYFLQLTFTEKTVREFMQNMQKQCLLKECCMLSCVGIYALFTLESFKTNNFFVARSVIHGNKCRSMCSHRVTVTVMSSLLLL